MTDLDFVSGEGLTVSCHGVMVTCLGPFVTSLLEGSGPGDQIIFPDFTMDGICALMPLIFTGK